MLSRRSILKAVPALLAAPAIVRVASLMPVKVWPAELYGSSPGMAALDEVREYYSNRVIRVYLDVKSIQDRNILFESERRALFPNAAEIGL